MRYKLTTRIPYFNFVRYFASLDELQNYMMTRLGEPLAEPNPCGTYKYNPRGEYVIEAIEQ
jgi:hypothetical protein